MTNLVLIGTIFVIIWCSMGGFEWLQVGIDVYIPRLKYQVKPHSSPWFSIACAPAEVHRNHFFRLYQQNKSSESKVKFREAINRCKRVLEAAKPAYANKIKESITSQKLGSRDFCRRMLGKDLQLKPTALSVFFLWLVESLKNLIIGLLIT